MADNTLHGKRIAFLGKLGGMSRREAVALLREHGAIHVNHRDRSIDIVVIGADELPLADDELLNEQLRAAVSSGELETITETELWERLGYVPKEGCVRQLYTPAMLADLLKVSISIIRRWQRRGLIVPVREVHRLAYFDFQEVATARHLAKLLSAGASPAAIEKKLAQLARWVPNAARPLAQLSIIIEGQDLLLRQGEGLVDATGQRRFDFDAADLTPTADPPATNVTESQPVARVFSLSHYGRRSDDPAENSKIELVRRAANLEEEGWLEEAIDMYRAALAVGGPDAEINFQIAEILYRLGDVTAARERYYSALELDEDYVESRA